MGDTWSFADRRGRLSYLDGLDVDVSRQTWTSILLSFSPGEWIGGVVGRIDAGNDGFGFVAWRGRVFVALCVDCFAGFVVDVEDFGHFLIGGVGLFGFGQRFMMRFPVVFEEAVFALEAAFGGGEVAEDEVVVFDFVGLPGGDGRGAVAEHVEVEFALDAEALPFGLGGSDDEGIEQGVFSGVLIAVEPGLEEFEPVGFDFAGHDEGGGAHAVAGGVAGGFFASGFGGGAGAAGISFLWFGRLFFGKHMFLS